MIKLVTKSKYFLDVKNVSKAVEQASKDPLKECATITEIEMRRLLSVGGGGGRSVGRGKPSSPGSPPHLQTANLRNSIRKAKEGMRNIWVIGPTRVAWYGRVHEFGAMIKVTAKMRGFLHSIGIHLKASTSQLHIPPRPFARPALHSAMKKYPAKFRRIGLANTQAGIRLNSQRNFR